jgi:hypothetical protein
MRDGGPDAHELVLICENGLKEIPYTRAREIEIHLTTCRLTVGEWLKAREDWL